MKVTLSHSGIFARGRGKPSVSWFRIVAVHEMMHGWFIMQKPSILVIQTKAIEGKSGSR